MTAARFCAVIFVAWLGLPAIARAADTVIVHFDEDLGALPRIHGVNSGPLVRKEWRSVNPPTIDMSAEFAATRIPESRAHDEGAGDMQTLWAYADASGRPSFAGHDPTDDASWKASGLAMLDERMTAAESVGVENLLRCGYSADRDPATGARPFSAPPDDFDGFARACAELLSRMTALGHTIHRVEVWNEPYIKDFWTGTALDYLRLYELTRQRIREVYGGSVAVGFHLALGPWVEPIALDIIQRQTNATPADDVKIDFFVLHLYFDRPHRLHERVYSDRVEVDAGRPDGVPPYEQFLEITRLPSDTPVIISEWNRGDGDGSRYARTAAAQPIVLGALTALIDLHPSMGPHHVELGHFYSARDGLWDDQGPRPAGVVFQIFGERMLGAAPIRVRTEGQRWSREPPVSGDPRSRGQELVVLASRSSDARRGYVALGLLDNRAGDGVPSEPGERVAIALEVRGALAGNWSAVQEELVDDGGPFNDRHGSLASVTTRVGALGVPIALSMATNSVSLVTLSYLGDDGGGPPADAGADGDAALGDGGGEPAADAGDATADGSHGGATSAETSGCGCRTSGRDAGEPFLILGALVAAWRGRRRARRAPALRRERARRVLALRAARAGLPPSRLPRA